MTSEIAVDDYQHDPDRNTNRHASYHVQTTGYAADGKEACERKRKQQATGATDPHLAYLHRRGDSLT
jgi:hypothetical protein